MHHIDTCQDWVQALCDRDLVKLAKVDTKNNLANLGMRLLNPDTFEQLRDCMMVCHTIPATDLELCSCSDSSAPAALMSVQQKALSDDVSADCVQVVGQTQAAQTVRPVSPRDRPECQ